MLVVRNPPALLALAAGRATTLATIDELRDPARQLQAAGARIFVNQQRMSQPSGGECGRDLLAGAAEPSRAGLAGSLRRKRREVRTPSRAPRAPPRRPCPFLRRVDHAKTRRRCARQFEVAVADPIEELRRLDLETIDGAASRLHALESDAHRHIEQQRAIGCEIAVHGLREVFDECAVDTTAPALVRVRGIGEAIAQHPLAARQCRAG